MPAWTRPATFPGRFETRCPCSRSLDCVSTASVYPDDLFKKSGVDETAPVAKLPDESVEKVTNETYGPLKALCEQAAEKIMPGHVTVIRPGLIVGPLDPTDRFTYWPVRVQR